MILTKRKFITFIVAFNLLLTFVLAQADQEFACFDRESQELKNQIVGSLETYTNTETPWMVNLYSPDFGEDSASFCGGSLINNTTVLTAAHCISSELRLSVRRVSEDSTIYGDAYEVTSYAIHPDYAPENPRAVSQGDIAVLKLATAVKGLSPSDLPRLLTPEDADIWAQSDDCARITGWGLTQHKGQASELLLGADLPIWSDDECAAVYSSIFDADSMVCAGYKEGVIGTCQGDSGGPLVVRGGPTGFMQIGVVSFGKECAAADAPGVFTEVSDFYDWIFEASAALSQ